MAASHVYGFTCLLRLRSCKRSPVSGKLHGIGHCMECQDGMAYICIGICRIPPYTSAACLVGRTDSGLLMDVTGHSQLACTMSRSKVNHVRTVWVLCKQEFAGRTILHA